MKRRMKNVIKEVLKALLHGGKLRMVKAIPETGSLITGTRTEDDEIHLRIQLVGEDKVSP